MALCVNLVCFAAFCNGSSKVTPPRGLGLSHSPPHFPTLSPYIYSPPFTLSACERCHGAAWEQKLCPHHCTNSPGVIKLSCFSYFADGYFHPEPYLVMRFVVSQEECDTHTNTLVQVTQSVSFLSGETNGIQVKIWCVAVRVAHWSSEALHDQVDQVIFATALPACWGRHFIQSWECLFI